MGVDLMLLPYDSSFFSHTILQVERDYALHDKIKRLPAMEVDDDFTSYASRDDEYEDTHYGNTTKDAYGDRVLFVLAKDLKTVGIPDPTGAYIKALDDKCKIALFWN